MKKLLLPSIFIFTIILFSCSSDESKAKKLIQEYMKENLNDYSSYEPISFGVLNEFITSFDEDDYSSVLNRAIEKLEEEEDWLEIYQLSNITDLIESTEKRIEEHKNDIEKEKAFIKEKKDSFVPEKRYSMNHKFRAANPVGGKILSEVTFEFDENLKEVVDVND